MATQSAMSSHSQGAEKSASGRSPLSLLSRHQRLLLHVGGLVTSLVLIAVTVVMVQSQVKDYVSGRYTEYVLRRTTLRAMFAVREAALRIGVRQEEYVWSMRQEPDPLLMKRFADSNGRIILQRNSSLPPALVIGDVSPDFPAERFGAYLRLADDVSYQSGAYSQELVAAGYLFSPDRRFVVLGPLPDEGSAQHIKEASAASLLQRIAPDIGDIQSPAARARLLDTRVPMWLPPGQDPLSGVPSIRLVQGAASEGGLFAVFVASYPTRMLEPLLASRDPNEASLIVGPGNGLLLGMAEKDTTAAVLRLSRRMPKDALQQLSYRDGYFIVSDEISDSGWRLLHAFSWRTVLAALWPRLASYIGAVLLMIGFVWAVLLLIDRKIFKPGFARSQRIIESEDLNRTIVTTAPFGLVLLSVSSGEVLLQNATMIGYADEARRDDPPLHARFLVLFDNGSVGSHGEREFHLALEDGSSCDLLVSGVRTKYLGADVLLCNFKDITLRKKTQHELEQARRAADEANHAKSTFLATMSHEIRTPLNTILGNLELLERTPLSDDQLLQLRTVASSSSTLLGVINDILDFSKVESGQMSIEAISFDIKELALQAVEFFLPVARAKGLQLESSLDDSLAAAYVGDPTRIRQIIYNLLSNAIKFTDHGDVLLEVYLDDESQPDPEIVIGVSDTGIGIGPEQQKSLFQTFQQADSTITRRFGGSGLGLALCRLLADLMNGRITVHSEVEVGSTFLVFLPLPVSGDTPVQVETAGSAALLEEVPASGLRVLVVDDHPANRQLIRRQLLTLGHASDQAEDGHEAIRLLAEKEHDLLMTDLHMPGMDGYTLARQLRDQGVSIPMVAITAYASEQDRQRCKDIGIDEVMTKPILLDALDKMIRRRLQTGKVPVTRRRQSGLMAGALPREVHQAMLDALNDSLRRLHGELAVFKAGAVIDDAGRGRMGTELHSIRGAFAMIQATAIADACARLEQLLQEADFSAMVVEVDALEVSSRGVLEQRSP